MQSKHRPSGRVHGTSQHVGAHRFEQEDKKQIQSRKAEIAIKLNSSCSNRLEIVVVGDNEYHFDICRHHKCFTLKTKIITEYNIV
jgi:hypothetical protein